jgi:polyhydroxybutyrate depolymerase
MRRAIAILLSIGCSSSASTTPTGESDSAIADDTNVTIDSANEETVDTAVTETTTEGCTGKSAQPLDQAMKVTVAGVERTFAVHTPKSYDGTKPTPIVLDFHGLYGDENQEQGLTKMNEKADAAGFISVHPRGVSSSWNAGACCGTARDTKVDDVGFVKAMLDALEDKLCVDNKRIFSTGMSNGGFLSHRLGCELSDRIAAIAPVAAVMGMMTCTPKRAVPIMHFHGTSDSLVPYGGNPSISYPSVADSIAGWAKRNACSTTTKETYSKGEVKCVTYDGCPTTVDVILCTVTGGGHTWPGGTAYPLLGKTTTDISATDAMWDFFKAHPMP